MNKNALKQQEKMYDERIKYLQLYLDHMTKENGNLKHQLQDMEMTAKQNKKLLREYIENMTNKDKIVEKLQCTNETLQERIKSQEEIIKKLLKQLEATDAKPVSNNNKKTNFINSIIVDENINKNQISDISQNRSLFTSNRIEHITSTNTHTVSLSQQANTTNVYNNQININKEFLNKYNNLMDEVTNLRQELQYLLENVEIFYKSKNEKKKLDKSFSDNNASFYSSSSHRSNVSSSTVKRKLNLKEKFGDVNKFQDMLNNYTHLRSVIILVDNKGAIWELVRRNDLVSNSLYNLDNISPILCKVNAEDNKLINIEIKENYDARSFNNSEMDLSKNSDLNISFLLKENNDY